MQIIYGVGERQSICLMLHSNAALSGFGQEMKNTLSQWKQVGNSSGQNIFTHTDPGPGHQLEEPCSHKCDMRSLKLP